MDGLEGLIKNAASDPRFVEILAEVKKKADSGELDVAAILGREEKKEGAPPAGRSAPGMKDHRALLAALRPYLADPKRGALDEILKIGEFSGIVEALSKGKNGG